jgi:hypothetical protein
MKRRMTLTAGIALCWAAFAAQPATAATTIGFVAPGSPPVAEGDAVAFSPTPAYAVPTDGVITAWSVNTGASPDTAAYVALKLFELSTDPVSGDLTARVIATSKPFFPTEGVQTHFTRIPVQGGEQIGLRSPESWLRFPSGAESSACGAKDTGPLGAVYVEGQSLTCASGVAANVSATLEPDGDGDGFGDETQDRCLGVKGRATGCPSRYRGRAAGLPFEFRFGTRDAGFPESERPVTVLERDEYGVRVRCPDGYETAFIVYRGVRPNFTIRIKGNGDFAYARGMARGDGIVGGRTQVSGHLQGARAHGTVSGTIKFRHHGTCKILPYSWRAHAR